MQKLIELSDTHYIVVDDSEIKEDDLVLNPLNEIQTYFKDYNFVESKKITHSTQPLEMQKMNSLGSHFTFVKIKQLFLSEVEELVYGYKTKFLKFFENEPNYKNYWKPLIESNPQLIEVHKELVKDKLFTVEDMEKAYEEGYGYRSEMEWEARYGYGDGKTIKGMKKDEYIQSLLPKTEWEVTFDEQGKIVLL